MDLIYKLFTSFGSRASGDTFRAAITGPRGDLVAVTQRWAQFALDGPGWVAVLFKGRMQQQPEVLLQMAI